MAPSHSGIDAMLISRSRPPDYLRHPIRQTLRPPAGFEAELRDDGMVWVRDDDAPEWRQTKFRDILRARSAAARARR